MASDSVPEQKFWQLAIADLEKQLATGKDGLSSADAASRRVRYGPNSLEERRHLSLPLEFVGRFRNPLVLILLVAAGISALTGDLTSFIIICTIVVTSALLDTVQEYRAKEAAESLKVSVALKEQVLRDGHRAYEIWEVEGRLHGDDLAHWFRAEAEFPPITVTFDTNALDRAVRPERFPKDLRQPEYLTVRNALACGAIRGFFCETLVIIEGVQRRDRAEVFASTRIRFEILPEIPGPNGIPAIPINLNVEQERPPPPAEMLARVQAALGLGFRVLGAPRVGQTRIADPNHTIYVDEHNDNSIIGKRLDRYHDLAVALEGRGVGASQIQKYAKQFAQRDGVTEAWCHSLKRAKDVHEENAVKRACAEWADGDSIAAHFGYEIDFFCTEDAGKSSGAPSIFDASNRSWVEKAYGVRFINLTDLAQMVS